MKDVLVRGGRILTCDPQRRELRGEVLVRDGRIAAVGRGVGHLAREGHDVIDARGCAVLPGLVQSHVHLCQTLMRGMAEDLPLLDWLRRRIWPLEAAHDETSLRVSAELGVAELLLGGTTAILDMGTTHGQDVVFEVCARLGIRMSGGKAMMDAGDGVPDKLRESTGASLMESDRLRKAWHGSSGGRLRYAYAPRFILSCSEALMRETGERCKADGILFHSHAAEHREERDAVRAALGRDDVSMLQGWGISGPWVVLAHGVQLTAQEIHEAARQGTRVVHCPSSNLKLGSGVAPLRAMLDAGVVVGIGCDGAPCNNTLDLWAELRHAALLARMRSGPDTMPSRDVLDLCTVRGAQVIGLGDEIGSIEAGKKADLVVVSLQGLHMQPVQDPVDALVLSGKAEDVRHVMVDGRVLVRNRELLGVDTNKLRRAAQREGRKLMARAGIG